MASPEKKGAHGEVQTRRKQVITSIPGIREGLTAIPDPLEKSLKRLEIGIPKPSDIDHIERTAYDMRWGRAMRDSMRD